jgi:hypothetical protein
MSYEIEGQLLEVCPCNVLCPCWIGEDPDGDGTCDSVNAYHVEHGSIDGIDVSGRTLAVITHIPGNVLNGNWRVALIVDDGAAPEQQEAIINAFTGKLGGPLADLAGLVSEVTAIESAPITFEVKEGKGSLRVGSLVEAEMEPYRGPSGQVTTLNETVFTTIPGAPAWVSKASTYRRNVSRLGLKDLELSGQNAIQGAFRFVG